MFVGVNDGRRRLVDIATAAAYADVHPVCRRRLKTDPVSPVEN
jgi:hypothetical protein